MKIEDYNKYYIQGSDHYLIPKDVFMELFNEMINWKEESKQLKNNWNELKDCLKDVMNSCEGDDKDFVETILDIIQEIEGSDRDE